MCKKFIRSLVLCCGLVGLNVNATLVDLELQLLADVSGSVDGSEYALQLAGYEASFRDAGVISAIESGTAGAIAVQYIEWSESTEQSVLVDWTLITDSITANAFADSLAAVTRAFDFLTAPGSAISFGASLFAGNGFDGTRQVIDVSGDGLENSGIDTSDARDAALSSGVDTINGITIGDVSGLGDWYVDNVIGGADAFHIHADNFEDFTTGITNKLVREITGTPVPAPGTFVMLSLAMLGLFGSYRKNNSK